MQYSIQQIERKGKFDLFLINKLSICPSNKGSQKCQQINFICILCPAVRPIHPVIWCLILIFTHTFILAHHQNTIQNIALLSLLLYCRCKTNTLRCSPMRQTRARSSFKPNQTTDFSKTAYMFPPQKSLRPPANNNSSFYQVKTRSLTNSVNDYSQALNNSVQHQLQAADAEYAAKHQQETAAPRKHPFEIMQLKGSQTARTARSFSSQRHCVVEDDHFRKTSKKITDVNFLHHDPEVCVCSHCTCGRHLCKLHVVKPDLHNNSIYRGDYNRKNPFGSLRVKPLANEHANGPHMDLNTTYGKDFIEKQEPVERHHPQDCLDVGGPAANLTTYSSGFPGYRGDNQYVRPTNNTHLNGMLPFNGDSSYRKFFVPKVGGPGDTAKWNNHFKNGEPWLGNTTYRDSFKQPDADYANRFKPNPHNPQDPDYGHQYETTYKNDFLGKGPMMCPAKIEIETRTKGKFGETKEKFLENADFKAMSPDFHAISTSKHSYV